METQQTERDFSLPETNRAILNILEDFGAERARLEETQRAVLNILDDSGEERTRQETMLRALLNILEDFGGEKTRFEETQRAIINILDDFEDEKRKVETVNTELRREVTERAAAEQALREKTDALARSNAELEQFAYVASHDLQEPLRMVSSYMQLFEKRYAGQVDAQAQKYINYAVEGAKRMQALIGGLLEFSRVGRVDEPFGVVDTGAALDHALLNLRSAVEESRAAVTRGPLPSVTGNASRLAQVFQNLVGNAIKFRKRDETPSIHVAAAPLARDWLFSVRDNGIGIDPQYLDRIFVIFQRLHTRAEYPGTGIGLSICKKVIERHGGRIWVESQPGAGATFQFTLPREP
ncbi:MAG TPA: ATP-binding protein [Anaeromyxobacteraceae bacterium]|nr:ATP-binding protein [Anaeromyxobacteraceae bacterium]